MCVMTIGSDGNHGVMFVFVSSRMSQCHRRQYVCIKSCDNSPMLAVPTRIFYLVSRLLKQQQSLILCNDSEIGVVVLWVVLLLCLCLFYVGRKEKETSLPYFYWLQLEERKVTGDPDCEKASVSFLLVSRVFFSSLVRGIFGWLYVVVTLAKSDDNKSDRDMTGDVIVKMNDGKGKNLRWALAHKRFGRVGLPPPSLVYFHSDTEELFETKTPDVLYLI